MKAGKIILGVGMLFCLFVSLADKAGAEDWPNWRGPNRDGISKETGLLKKWPNEGPEKVWSLPGIGEGYASVAVVGDMIYTTGSKGGMGTLFAIKKDGTIAWQKPFAKEGGGRGYAGSRSTPAVYKGKVYVQSTLGEVCCHDAKTGEQKWKVDTRSKYGAKLPSWEKAESLLVEDGKVIVTVGGSKATVVALDADTGKEVWKSKSIGGKSAYCSPMLINYKGKSIILDMVDSGLIGVDFKNGKILFEHGHKNRYAVHPNTPIFDDGMIYVTSGYGYGGEMLTLSSSGVSKKWFSKDLAVHHGGAILFDGCVMGGSDREWVAIDLKSGKTKWKEKLTGKGSLVMADGMIYGYGEKRGTVGLIKADKNGAKLVSSFRVREGSKQHWAHPVVSGGRLYIRHGDVLMSYNVKK